MTTPRLITLELWLAETYGDAITLNTARRWCRDRKISPLPEKHGRTYFVTPDARYTIEQQTQPAAPEQPSPAEAGGLVERLKRAYAAETPRSVAH